MTRLDVSLALLLVAVCMLAGPVATPAMAAGQPCADLADQITSLDQQLDQSRLDALPWLQQASLSGLLVSPELLVAVQQGALPDVSPGLAQADGAIAEQVSGEIVLFLASADSQSSASFLSDLARHLSDWEGRLVLLLPLAQASPSAQALQAALLSLDLVSAQAQGTLALRDGLNSQLNACPSSPAGAVLGCGLAYFGLDRSGPNQGLKPAVPGLRADVQPGDQWDDASSSDVQTPQGAANIAIVDTYRCTPDGVTKVGRKALETFPDGTTTAWGERDYSGTLWPKTIVPGATWVWQAIQYTTDPEGVQPDYEETWNVSVHELGRETVTLPTGRFEAIHIQLDEDILQPGGETQHYSWDEWYARPSST